MPENKKSKNPVIQPVGDPWEYSKKGNQFITRRKGDKDWIVASGGAKDAIATRIFDQKPKTLKQPSKPTQLQEATVVGKRPETKLSIPDMTGRTANPLQAIQPDNQMYGPFDMEEVTIAGQRPFPSQPDQPTQLQEASIIGKRPIPKNTEIASIIGRPLKSKITGKPYELPGATIVGKKPSSKKPTLSKDGTFMGVDVEFAKDFYKDKGVKKDFIFVVDKPTGKMYRLNLGSNKVDALGEVGLGKNIGDRDVSGGRTTGQGSNMTQSGWSKINRTQPYPNRSQDYGDEFHGFSSLVDGKWKEVPTGIHGSENETCGRVSGGCTRLPGETEDLLQDELDLNTLLYYTSDQKENQMKTYQKGGKLPTNRNAALADAGSPLLTDMFKGSVNPTADLKIRANRDRYQTANFFGGLPSQALTDLKSDPERYDRFFEYSKERGAKKRADVSDYMLRYNPEVDKPFNVPLGFSVPDAINRTSVGAPQGVPQTQLPFENGGLLPNEYGLPELGFGSWLKDNASGLLKGAGALASAIPIIGSIAGPVLKGIGGVVGSVQANKVAQGQADADQLALDEQVAAQEEQQALADRQTRASNIVDQGQASYGATFENGGPIGQGFTGQPQITEYTNGQKHGESAVGGIPVDARGNPATTSRQSAVGLTEKGEVTWNGYVFSDKLKIK